MAARNYIHPPPQGSRLFLGGGVQIVVSLLADFPIFAGKFFWFIKIPRFGLILLWDQLVAFLDFSADQMHCFTINISTKCKQNTSKCRWKGAWRIYYLQELKILPSPLQWKSTHPRRGHEGTCMQLAFFCVYLWLLFAVFFVSRFSRVHVAFSPLLA